MEQRAASLRTIIERADAESVQVRAGAFYRISWRNWWNTAIFTLIPTTCQGALHWVLFPNRAAGRETLVLNRLCYNFSVSMISHPRPSLIDLNGHVKHIVFMYCAP